MTAFLVILSSWILTLVIQENKNTRLVYNSISTYEWAQGANEYALLKIKNHQEWFQDEIANNDYDSKLLALDPNNINSKDTLISYEITNYSRNYDWSINSWEFDIIPLFFDTWSIMQINSKNPTWAPNIIKTSSLKLVWDWDYTWNILWNDITWNTYWIVWIWTNWTKIWTWYITDESIWDIKTIENDNNYDMPVKRIRFSTKDIGDFLNEYSSNYLIIYNNSKNPIKYNLQSNEGFSLPKLKVVTSAKIGNFKQNLEFSDDKNKYFEALKYSIFSK